jgi:L-malate glycosyltransferase
MDPKIADRALRNPTEAESSLIRLFLMVNNFETGGSERQFTVLARNLPADSFRAHVGCIHRVGPFAEDFGDVPEFPMGGSLYGLSSWSARLRLSRELRRQHIQIAHAFDFYTNLTLIPAARLARTPVVIGSQRQLGDLLTPRQFRAQLAAFRFCAAVICNSSAAADRLAESGISREKLFVIGNALPSEAFAPAQPAIPPQPGKLRVGMIARMNHRYKGHSSFLRIAQRVSAQMPNVDFVLAGDGPLRPDYEREARTVGIADRVIFLGDRRDIPAVLASIDLAVLTSDSESLSNVILEAMASRLPAIAYRVGGNAELIDQDRGDLLPFRDEEAFAGAILRLLTDPNLRRQLGSNARKFAEENFSLSRVLDRYQQCYKTLLGQKGLGSQRA